MAMIAVALPSTSSESRTRTSVPGAGNASYPCRTRSTLISPTQRTFFKRSTYPVPAVDLEAGNDARDHAGFRRRVRPVAGLAAAEEGEELPHQRVEQGQVFVGARRARAAVEDERLLRGGGTCGNVGPHHDAAHAERLPVELVEQVEL